MAGLSTYLANEILDTYLAGAYLALFTTNPTAAGTGTEVSGVNYARQAVTFDAAVNGATSNADAVAFPVCGGSWGTISHWAVYDAVSGGHLLYFGEFPAPSAFGLGEQLVIDAGALDIAGE